MQMEKNTQKDQNYLIINKDQFKKLINSSAKKECT